MVAVPECASSGAVTLTRETATERIAVLQTLFGHLLSLGYENAGLVVAADKTGGAVIIRIGIQRDRRAESDALGEIACFAVAVTRCVTTDIIYTVLAGALIIIQAGRSVLLGNIDSAESGDTGKSL